MTSDEIRSKLTGLYEQAKPMLSAFGQYAESARALVEELHLAKFAELGHPALEATVLEIDTTQTPASLDRALAGIAPGQIKSVCYDRTKRKLFVAVSVP
jgi:hypothetical protein